MRILGTYPLVTTADPARCRDFYQRHFGMEVLFEASWVVMLARAGETVICLGFMSPDHPSTPPGPEPFSGQGMIVTMEVDDAAAAHASLGASGAPIVYGLHDEPWGQRRFMTRDPAGTLIDVVEQIEPAPGFWDQSLR